MKRSHVWRLIACAITSALVGVTAAYLENKRRLKVLAVNGGRGCVSPSTKTVQNATYKPLSRPLYLHVKRDSFRRAAVTAFIRHMIQRERRIAKAARFVPLTTKQLSRAKSKYNYARRTR